MDACPDIQNGNWRCFIITIVTDLIAACATGALTAVAFASLSEAERTLQQRLLYSKCFNFIYFLALPCKKNKEIMIIIKIRIPPIQILHGAHFFKACAALYFTSLLA